VTNLSERASERERESEDLINLHKHTYTHCGLELRRHKAKAVSEGERERYRETDWGFRSLGKSRVSESLLRALAQREREIERASERAIARQRKRVRGGFGWWSEEPNQLIKSYDFTRLLIEKYRFFFFFFHFILDKK
jgi:hypothetical protein